MFHSSHDWPCKLLLMCHWLELFIERDELGHEGVEFDLWQCIWGLKTPPHWELCVFVHGAVLQYVRVHVCACVRLPREYNSQQTQRLLCSFEAPRMKKLSWEINKSGVMLSQVFSFLLLMAQEVFNHVPFFFFFFCLSFGSTAFRTTKPNTLVGRICHSINACLYFFAFHCFTASMSNQPLWSRPRWIAFSTAATMKLLMEAVSFNLHFLVAKEVQIFYLNHTKFTLISWFHLSIYRGLIVL